MRSGRSMTNVIIVGGNDETSLLLRGLLRLHRQRVLGEGTTPSYLARLPDGQGPEVLLLDVDLEDSEWFGAVRSVIGAHPGMRTILLTPTRSGRVEELARQAGVAHLLRRPFAVHELIEAVDPGALSGTLAQPRDPLGPQK